MDDRAARDRIGRVEALLDEVESLPDEAGRAAATELVQALVELYGEGLARIVARVNGATDDLLEDELVEHLLLLHDLHPVPLEERVRGALEEVRPFTEAHAGGVELLSVEDGVVRLRLAGSCSGCPSSTMSLKRTIEDAIREKAPDVDEIVAEGMAEERTPRGHPLPQASVLQLPQAPVPPARA